jgi:hypothetical protein
MELDDPIGDFFALIFAEQEAQLAQATRYRAPIGPALWGLGQAVVDLVSDPSNRRTLFSLAAAGAATYCVKRAWTVMRANRKPVLIRKPLSADDDIVFPGGKPEAMVGNSTFFQGSAPSYQVAILNQDGNGAYRDVGCGVRYKDFLIVPDHVYDVAYVSGPIFLASAISFAAGTAIPARMVCEVGDDTFLPFVADFRKIPISPDLWTNIGVKTAKSASGTLANTASITDSSGAKSHGQAVIEDMFTVSYHGSTRQGFSGAPYVISGQIYGIHQRGHCGSGKKTPYNEGVPFGLITALCEKAFAYSPEGSTQEAKGNKRSYPKELRDFNPQSLEDYRVEERNGKFNVLFRSAAGAYRHYYDVPEGVVSKMARVKDAYLNNEDTDFSYQRTFAPQNIEDVHEWDDEARRPQPQQLQQLPQLQQPPQPPQQPYVQGPVIEEIVTEDFASTSSHPVIQSGPVLIGASGEAQRRQVQVRPPPQTQRIRQSAVNPQMVSFSSPASRATGRGGHRNTRGRGWTSLQQSHTN